MEQFQEAATWLVDQKFPHKMVTVTEGELPYFTEEVKNKRRAVS